MVEDKIVLPRAHARERERRNEKKGKLRRRGESRQGEKAGEDEEKRNAVMAEGRGFPCTAEEIPCKRETLLRGRNSTAQEKWQRWKRGQKGWRGFGEDAKKKRRKKEEVEKKEKMEKK